ncbi:MAG: hypothetical protein QXG39_05045 [Candidatus Aenigmatarchaeota archaeon]
MEEIKEVKIGNEYFKLRVLTAWEYGEIEDQSIDWSRGFPIPKRRLREIKFLTKSLVGWSLKDSAGKPLPIDEENVKKLPEPLFARLITEFNRLHTPVGAEEMLKNFFLEKQLEQQK